MNLVGAAINGYDSLYGFSTLFCWLLWAKIFDFSSTNFLIKRFCSFELCRTILLRLFVIMLPMVWNLLEWADFVALTIGYSTLNFSAIRITSSCPLLLFIVNSFWLIWLALSFKRIIAWTFAALFLSIVESIALSGRVRRSPSRKPINSNAREGGKLLLNSTSTCSFTCDTSPFFKHYRDTFCGNYPSIYQLLRRKSWFRTFTKISISNLFQFKVCSLS